MLLPQGFQLRFALTVTTDKADKQCDRNSEHQWVAIRLWNCGSFGGEVLQECAYSVRLALAIEVQSDRFNVV